MKSNKKNNFLQSSDTGSMAEYAKTFNSKAENFLIHVFLSDESGAENEKHEKTFNMVKWDSFITRKFPNVVGVLLPFV